jgi:inner membrane protein
MLWHRFVRRGDTTDQPVNIRWLLIGSAIAVFSHPALDWLNTYGVRFLMPFSDRWFYGDTLFIVDLILLVLFGAGWWISRRARLRDLPFPTRPARTAVALALGYIVVMKVQSERSRSALTSALALENTGPRQVMIAPLPVTMRSRSSLVVADSGYALRRVRAGIAHVRVDSVYEYLPTRVDHPLTRLALATDEYRRFARWSRFPYFIPNPDGDTNSVFVGDARYARGSSDTWAGVRIRVR